MYVGGEPGGKRARERAYPIQRDLGTGISFPDKKGLTGMREKGAVDRKWPSGQRDNNCEE